MSIWTDKQGRVHVGIMVSGQRIHRRLSEGATARDAKLVEAELRRAASRKEAAIPGDPQMTAVMGLYLEHAAKLRSPETARFHAMRVGPWIEGVRASNVSVAMAKMVKDMHGHYAPGTINRSLGAVKAALKLAYRGGMLPEDYGSKITRLPENNERHFYLSIEQVKILADACSEQARAAVWIALLTGCRRGEILKLQPEDIQDGRLRIRAGNTKTLRERTVPIVPALRPWLAYLPIAINEEGLKSSFRRAREKTGMPHIHFHDLRHSCASLLINMGVSLEVVRDILGHTSIKTTERYAHLDVERQQEALMMLSKAVAAA